MSTDDSELVRLSIERICKWMNANGAPSIAANLASAASLQDQTTADAECSASVPDDLRALWLLHNGQVKEGNGLFECYDFLSIQWAIAQREAVLESLSFARTNNQWWINSGGTDEELHSDTWIPFAARDSDSLAIHAVSERVFRFDHDDSPCLVAPSLQDWLRAFANRVEAGDYKVEPGFGDYHLALRDREAEKREQEREQKRMAHEATRHVVPLLDQFAKAVSLQDADRCIEIFRDALKRSDQDSFNAAVSILFQDDISNTLVASALRPVLNNVTLSPDQWLHVAAGGALLENNSIRDFAVARTTGFSPDARRKLEQQLKIPSQRNATVLLIQKLQMPIATAEKTGWLSRLFGKKEPPEPAS
jgi:cell wall assembly regulator SMI1